MPSTKSLHMWSLEKGSSARIITRCDPATKDLHSLLAKPENSKDTIFNEKKNLWTRKIVHKLQRAEKGQVLLLTASLSILSTYLSQINFLNVFAFLTMLVKTEKISKGSNQLDLKMRYSCSGPFSLTVPAFGVWIFKFRSEFYRLMPP